MVDCTLVVNENKNNEENGKWLFRFAYNEYLKKILDKLDEEKAKNFESTNVICQSRSYLKSLNVKNNKFVTNDDFADDFVCLMSIENIKDNKTNKENIGIKRLLVNIDDLVDHDNFMKLMDFTDVVFLQPYEPLTSLNLTDKKSLTLKKTFKSVKSDNKIKIKDMPQDVAFEKVDINGKQETLLKEYGVKFPEQIELLTTMLLTKTKRLNVHKEYFMFLPDFCAYTFNPNVCTKDNNTKILKKTYDLLYNMVQTYCHDEYMRKITPIFPYNDTRDKDLIKEWLPILKDYVGNHKNFDECQLSMFKNAWKAILKVSTDGIYDFISEFVTKKHYDEFTQFLGKIDDFVPIMDDLEVYMESADKVIKQIWLKLRKLMIRDWTWKNA